jgi:hypothetical protein
MATSHPCFRRATTSLLVAVALISGAMLPLGDRFEPASSYALSQPVRLGGAIAACVAEENMRLVALDRERCRPEELELASERVRSEAQGPDGPAGPPGPPGPAGRAGTDGISGFEIVSVKLAVGGRATAAGEARCPAGKVAVGGGVMPNPESPVKSGGPDDRMEVVVAAVCVTVR